MWDEEDGFFYDVLRLPDGQRPAAQGRSMVGPAAAVRRHRLRGRAAGRSTRSSASGSNGSSRPVPKLAPRSTTRSSRRRGPRGWLPSWTKPSCAGCWRRCSTRTSSSARSASARCRAITPTSRTSSTPAARNIGVAYLPAESDTGMFGGNSNWRGPIWMPVNALIIRALLQYYTLLRQRLHRRMPDRLRAADEPVSGRRGDLAPAREHLPAKTRTAGGRSTAAPRSSRRTRTGAICLLFYEYFHGDNGAGLGASHQTGWTGVIARIMHLFATMTPEQCSKAARGLLRGTADRGEPVRPRNA